MDLDGNGQLDDGEPRGSYALNPIFLTNDVENADITLTVPLEGWTIHATHQLAEYPTPGEAVIECTVRFPTDQNLLSLGWTVELPDGWTLVSAQGDGAPIVNSDTGAILFSGPQLTNNPIRFSYTVGVPAGQVGTKSIGGAVDFYLSGMGIWDVAMAQPNPLLVDPVSPYHTADFRDPRWVIDLQEVNRVLSYWRSGGYSAKSGTIDGYAPGNAGARQGALHKADYQEPFWEIDGEEALRVVGYWMAGGYHVDPDGLDGYAPGRIEPDGLSLFSEGEVTIQQQVPATYMPGSTVTMQGTLEYDSDIVAVLWKPMLPAGWNIISVTANDGDPEVVNNEILFTAKLPPSPIEITYVCEVPTGMSVDALVQTDVQVMRIGRSNPESLMGQLSPALLQLDSDGDGLPDWVETGTGIFRSLTDTGTDPFNADTSGNGMSDWEMIMAGLDPNDPDATFRIVGLRPADGPVIMTDGTSDEPFILQWLSAEGIRYSVYRTTNLLQGFIPLRTNILSTPPVTSFIDAMPPDGHAVYVIGVDGAE